MPISPAVLRLPPAGVQLNFPASRLYRSGVSAKATDGYSALFVVTVWLSVLIGCFSAVWL
jgi:hypothetical protein